MKNNTLSGSYYPKNPQIKHFFRIMRITLFLLMACVFLYMPEIPILKIQELVLPWIM